MTEYHTIHQSGKMVNWSNFAKSFLIALCILVIQLIAEIILINYIKDERLINYISSGIRLLIVGIVARQAYVYETGKYKGCTNHFVLGVLTYFLGAIGVWATAYQILQIKAGNVHLAPEKAKE